MSINNNYTSPLFECYIFKKGEKIPENLDLEGSIAITRDEKPRGFLHVLFLIAQKIHNLLFGRKDDPTMAHGMVILKRFEGTNDLIVSHAVLTGIKTSKTNYLDSWGKDAGDVTELVVYIPKDEKLRDLIIKNAKHSTYNPIDPNCAIKKENMNPFALPDFARSFFSKPIGQPSKSSKKRLALALTDLLAETQIKNRSGKPRALICIAFAIFILQTSLLMQALTNEEKNRWKALAQTPTGREKVATEIFKRIEKPLKNDPLSQAYWENRICSCISARNTFSSFARSILDEQSELKKT